MFIKLKIWFEKLSPKEKTILLISLIIFLIGAVWLGKVIYETITIPIPAYGGELKEGILGQPTNLNPLIPASDTDKKINELIYDSLFRIEANGQIKPELARGFSLSDDKLTYTINLNPAVKWQDGQNLTSNDVVFTFNSLLNPDLRSPLAIFFQGVSIDKIDQQTVEFKVARPYNGFLINLTKVNIIPQHIWENVPTLNWAVSDYDKKPVGSGPFLVEGFEKSAAGLIQSYTLGRNENYFLKKPYLKTIKISFYQSQEDLRKDLNEEKIDATSDLEPTYLKNLFSKKTLGFENYILPRYFAIFFNLTKFSNAQQRKLIDNAIDRNKLINKVFEGRAEILQGGPFSQTLMGLFNLNLYATSSTASPLANQLSFNLMVPQKDLLLQTAQEIQQQLGQTNIIINIQPAEAAKFAAAVKNRDFEALLFGEAFDLNFDLYSLWASGQDNNIPNYKNKSLDATLEEMKLIQSPAELTPDIKSLALNLKNDVPAVFLFNPYLIYAHQSSVFGPQNHTILDQESDYFSDVENWYVKTKRILK